MERAALSLGVARSRRAVPPEVPMAKVFHPSASSVSFDGEEFKASKGGEFDVPPEAIPHLHAHGFRTSREEAVDAARPKKAPEAPPPSPRAEELMRSNERLHGALKDNDSLTAQRDAAVARVRELEEQQPLSGDAAKLSGDLKAALEGLEAADQAIEAITKDRDAALERVKELEATVSDLNAQIESAKKGKK